MKYVSYYLSQRLTEEFRSRKIHCSKGYYLSKEFQPAIDFERVAGGIFDFIGKAAEITILLYLPVNLQGVFGCLVENPDNKIGQILKLLVANFENPTFEAIFNGVSKFSHFASYLL